MVCRDRLLIGPPLLDDQPSSRSNTTSCAACANGWLVDACRRGHRDLGSDLVRRGHGDAYQGIAAPPIVDPETIVRLPFLPARLPKGDRQHKSLLTQRPFSWMDHLIRTPQQRRRDREPEGLGGLEVDHQVELRGMLDREVRGLGALENLVNQPCGATKHVIYIFAVVHETASVREFA